MKKLKIASIISMIMVLIIATNSFAQYIGYSWGTTYQIVNIGTDKTNIGVNYYDSSGVLDADATRTFTDIAAGASVKVIQVRDDTNLGSGIYSAVVNAGQPIAAIVNQELYLTGSTSPKPPFSSYSGISLDDAGNKVILPVAMYNYYTYYTEMTIMNVDSSNDATSITIDYYPTTVNGSVTGVQVLGKTVPTLKPNQSITISQKEMTELGNPRFLGSAIVNSPNAKVAVVVNQHSPENYKLMTYNGFVGGDTVLYISNHMRGYYGYYNSLTIANPNNSDACVRLTYTPSGPYNKVLSGTIEPVTVDYKIDAFKNINRYDGPTASDSQSDLDDTVVYSRFFGSVKIQSITSSSTLTGCPSTPLPIVAITNGESISGAAQSSQSGSFNSGFASKATQKLASPMAHSSFYGYYTSIVVQNTTAVDTTCSFTYTSDSVESTIKNHTEVYNESLPANGVINIYEGTSGGERGHINTDPAWSNGTYKRFNGSVIIECGQPVVGYANLEADILSKDSMYSFNLVNLQVSPQ